MDAEQKIIIIFSIVFATIWFFIIPSAEIGFIDAIYNATVTDNPNANFVRDILYFFIIPFIAIFSILESAVKIRKYLLGS